MFHPHCQTRESGEVRTNKPGVVMLALLAMCLSPATAFASITWTTAVDAAGAADTVPMGIRVLPTNEFYVTGVFRGNPNFSGTTLVSQGGADVFLAKYANPGQLEWVVRAGSAQDDRGEDIDVDAAGNVYMTGEFVDSGTFDSTDGTTKTVIGSNLTIFLAKYSPTGVLTWLQTGVSDGGFGSGVAVDANHGMVYLTGMATASTVFSSQGGTAKTVAGGDAWHMVLAKYDISGNFQWGEWNSAAPNSIPEDVAVDKYGNAYVTGWMEGSTEFYSQDGNTVTVTGFSAAQSNTDYPDDAFLVKYDAGGNVRWANHVGG